ncbi:unnamed protein product [Darwinula stevensoni]|uniref:FAD-binding PCMH-type domain-containing protein n=1 Tax=Darwinula stevensoni TaxID=69355 RepID=A0A7R8X7N6_9CRUS|nr:unnamed protein product [Darwinula stevensoni]CAG0889280.1 unnamed protein product [Darwinula stevensoni]
MSRIVFVLDIPPALGHGSGAPRHEAGMRGRWMRRLHRHALQIPSFHRIRQVVSRIPFSIETAYLRLQIVRIVPEWKPVERVPSGLDSLVPRPPRLRVERVSKQTLMRFTQTYNDVREMWRNPKPTRHPPNLSSRSLSLLLEGTLISVMGHYSVNACLMPVAGCHGLAVTTVEGIGNSRRGLHVVQERLAKFHGSQCGFCTPGIVMSMYTLLRNDSSPSIHDMDEYLQGNLCRCTGYRPIIEGLKTFTSEFKCCKGENGGECACMNSADTTTPEEEEHPRLVQPSHLVPYDPTQEPIFPPELKLNPKYETENLVFKGSRVTWYRPASLDEMLRLKATHPEARIIHGNTEVALEIKFKNCKYPVMISPTAVSELHQVKVADNGVRFGGSVTLTTIQETLQKEIDSRPEGETKVWVEVVEMLRWFAGRQIRNVSSVAGNIVTSSPISDLNPLFQAVQSRIFLQSSGTVVPLSEIFTSDTGLPLQNVHPLSTWLFDMVDRGFFYKFWLEGCRHLGLKLPPGTESVLGTYHKDFPKASQYFQIVPGGQPKWDAVGRPMVAKSAYHQATGEAQFVDDIPPREKEAHLALVFSRRSHAKLLHVDPSPALGIKGVIGWVGEEDLPGEANFFGEEVRDESAFQRDKVTSEGQVIGGILAETREIAKIAARSVRVEYEDLQPRIITIEDAIKEREFFWEEGTESGDVDEALSQAPHVLEGQVRVGGQEHFYLEPQCSLVTPLQEHDEVLVYSSTQNPMYVQKCVAQVLGVPYNRVIAKVKRVGGGFGGKEMRSVLYTLPAAVAARKFGRPVRCVLDRDEDMLSSGGRHPFLGRYKVGFSPDGRILALDVTLYSNAGYSPDLSIGVMFRSMHCVTNAYHIPNVRVRGYVCRTNLPSNTAFRAFGSPQAMMICEQWMQDVAEFLRLDPAKVSSSEFNAFCEWHNNVMFL